MQNQEHYQSEVSITDMKKMLFSVASENYLCHSLHMLLGYNLHFEDIAFTNQLDQYWIRLGQSNTLKSKSIKTKKKLSTYLAC